MERSRVLLEAVAKQYLSAILKSNIPAMLQPKHLLRMCDDVANHARDWSEEKLICSIGIIQEELLENDILGLDEAKVMFAQAREYHGSPNLPCPDR